jgi:antitoxin component YwqK of YwqJK toxin-antitoxin module
MPSLRHAGFPLFPLFGALGLTAALLASQVQAQTQCEVNGKEVNPAHGGTTAGVTGLMRCRDREGRLTREQELQDGKFMGLHRYYQDGKLVRERRVNERGNNHGIEKHFWPGGQVKSEANYDNGSEMGASRHYFESGQLSRVTFYEIIERSSREAASINYNTDGSLREIRCAARSVMPEDRTPCGFAGRRTSTFFILPDNKPEKSAEQTWDNGRLLAYSTYRAGPFATGNVPSRRGQLHTEARYENGPGTARIHRSYDTEGHPDNKNTLREERIYEAARDADTDRLSNTRAPLVSFKKWSPREQLIQHTRYTGGQLAQDEQWWLNGQIKLRTSREGDGPAARMRSEHFGDDGKLRARTLETLEGDSTGVQQAFHPNGRLAIEETYSTPTAERRNRYGGNTRVIARKEWDESGKLLADDEILEDGSRRKR